MEYIYIHGFNSGPESRSGRELERLLGCKVNRVHLDYSRTFDDCLASLYGQINSFHPDAGAPLCVMGTSLGGFYALQLRLPSIAVSLAWNPVIYPAMQLAQFLGHNTRFTDNTEWNFSQEALYSYAHARDPRSWDNAEWRSRYESAPRAIPCRMVFIGTEDEILNPPLGLAYWSAGERVTLRTMPCGHHVPDFSDSVEMARNVCQLS